MSAPLLAGLARTTVPETALRRVLALDAVVTGGNGLAYAVFAAPLGRLLGVDRPVLLVLGLLLAAYGAWLSACWPRAAARRLLPVRCVIEVNYVWAALSLLSLFLWFSPTAAGAVWIPAQALVVASFAVLQQLALRSTGSGAQ